MDPIFKYTSGEEVHVGDRLKVYEDRWRRATVTKMVAVGERVANDLECPHGGVFIEVEWERTKDLVLETPPDGVLDPDYVLLDRHDGAEDCQ